LTCQKQLMDAHEALRRTHRPTKPVDDKGGVTTGDAILHLDELAADLDDAGHDQLAVATILVNPP
jgi:hypothetical protein